MVSKQREALIKKRGRQKLISPKHGWNRPSKKWEIKCRTVQSFTVDIKFNLSYSFQDLSLCLIYAVGVFIYLGIGATFECPNILVIN